MPETTHVAAICLRRDLVPGEVCDLSIAVAVPTESRDGFGREYTGYAMGDQVVYHSELATPLDADHPAELAVAEAEDILAAYGWTRTGDWSDDLGGAMYAELAPRGDLRNITLVAVPNAGPLADDSSDLADPDTPVIVGLMTHPAVIDFIAASGYLAGGAAGSPTLVHVFLPGQPIFEDYPTLTVELPRVPLTGRALENLGLPKLQWLHIDWGVDEWVFACPDNQVHTALHGRMWLLDVPADTRIAVPQSAGEVTVPTGGYLITNRGPAEASWVETTKHSRHEAHAAFAQRGGFACPDCEMPLAAATDPCPRCTPAVTR